MHRTEREYYSKLFEKFVKDHEVKGGFADFKKIIRYKDLFHVPLILQKGGRLKHAELLVYLKKIYTGHSFRKAETIKMFEAVKKTRKTSSVASFIWRKYEKGMVCPLVSDGVVFGVIIFTGIKKDLSSKVAAILNSYVVMAVKESAKEVELEDLNETIRPRAVALSTVHTVHRLMSSTLHLSELLPRIARLSLQVMKANRCSIKLLDKRRKTLLPMTTVDLRRKKTKLKKVDVGKYAPGRAVKQVRTILSKRYLATPLIEGDVLGVITLYDKLDDSEFTHHDAEIMKTLAEQAVIAIKNAQLYQEQENLTMGSIHCIAMLLQARPHGSFKAEASFLKLISKIGTKFNMNETEIKMMQYAAMLHDTGQITIPERVLMKRGLLTGKEYDIIKSHTLKGANILSKSKALKPIIPIILCHHENFNGTGYPKGLKGEDIPLSARILAVVSAFEAMITEKPYRKALSIDAAIAEVRKNSGSQFDPEVVEVFCESVTKNILKLLKKELGK